MGFHARQCYNPDCYEIIEWRNQYYCCVGCEAQVALSAFERIISNWGDIERLRHEEVETILNFIKKRIPKNES